MLGACERLFILPNDYPDISLQNFKLGEDLHKFRSNSYSSIWSDIDCVNELIFVGYTKTSIEAGINASERWGKSRIDNKWANIQKILEWLFKKYGHINFTQNHSIPNDFPINLLLATNYKNIF